MKYPAFILTLAALVSLCPLYGQSPTSSRGGKGQEEAAPKTGVRFVMCPLGNYRMPTPLYYQTGKDTYKSVTISTRNPTPRIRPDASGKIEFFNQDPSQFKDSEKANQPKPTPALTINAPSHSGGKTLCIVVPGETLAKSRTLFLNEADFPTRGVHIINFSPIALSVATSKKGDFTDSKTSVVGPYHRDQGITKANSWTYQGGTHGEQVAFNLKYQEKPGEEPKYLKRSKFIVSDRQSQINLIVRDQERNMLKILSVQLMAD